MFDRGIAFHNSELLRDIALSLNSLAGMAPPAETSFDVLNIEASEHQDSRWPYVDVDDWCGEFVPKVAAS